MKKPAHLAHTRKPKGGLQAHRPVESLTLSPTQLEKHPPQSSTQILENRFLFFPSVFAEKEPKSDRTYTGYKNCHFHDYLLYGLDVKNITCLLTLYCFIRDSKCARKNFARTVLDASH
jgi:hypothetical protein